MWPGGGAAQRIPSRHLNVTQKITNVTIPKANLPATVS